MREEDERLKMAESVEVKVATLEADVAGVKERVRELEEATKENKGMAIAVEKLAVNMEYMLKEQREIKDKVQRIEMAPAEDQEYFRREIVKCIVCGVLGALVAALMTLLLK